MQPLLMPDENSLTDPRVASSYGGGLICEQHWGRLVNGLPFYFRMRHNSATLKIGPPSFAPGDLPLGNPFYVEPTLTEEHKVELREQGATEKQINEGEAYVQIEMALTNPHAGYFWGPIGHVIPYEDDQDQGCFEDDETRQRVFTECLNQIEAVEYGDAFTVDPAIFDREEVSSDKEAGL